MSKETPMMKQYNQLKASYPDCILFFRLGDFYEMFGEDAIICSEVLNITLTSRSKNKEDALAMCGVPHHSKDNYIFKLTQAGHKVALCEQIKTDSESKIVQREVVSVITKSSNFSDNSLEDPLSNYLLLVEQNTDKTYNCILADLFSLSAKKFERLTLQDIEDLIIGHQVCELVSKNLDFDCNYSFLKKIKFNDDSNNIDQYFFNFLKFLKLEKLNEKISFEKNETNSKTFKLCKLSIKNLEIFNNYDGSRENTFFGTINNCITAMGQRLLYNFVLNPCLDKATILQRQKYTIDLDSKRESVIEILRNLKSIKDIQRLCTKLISGNANPKDLISLKYSLQAFEEIQKIRIQEWPSKYYNNDLFKIEEILNLLEMLLDENPMQNENQGFIFKQDYNDQLSELRTLVLNSKDEILKIQEKEKNETGINNLKIKYNKVFGYFIEVSKGKLTNINTEKYVRKQTLVNAERFITEELKELENKIITSESKMIELERDLFYKLCDNLKGYSENILNTANIIAEIDVWINFYELKNSLNLNYPQIENKKIISITNGFHPVISKQIGVENFIVNDASLNSSHFGYVITGPNMGGKSTFLRQIALIVLMAQIGMPVSAKEATIGICDQIFTRVGASDNINLGQSTFMVEMLETAEILKGASPNSLILLDELGRGTSTSDGLSLAKAVLKHLDQKIEARFIFATHYHELIGVVDELKNVENYHMQVLFDDNKKPLFTKKIAKGGMADSFGFFVAEMAGIPKEIILDGEKFKCKIEQPRREQQNLFEIPEREKEIVIVDTLNEKLKDVNVNEINPLQALNLLHSWKSTS